MVTQGLSLPNSMFGSIAADLQSVANIYTKSQALGRQIQNMDSQFNTQFPCLSERHELEKPERLDGVGLFTVLDLELK